MEEFDLKKFLLENKSTVKSKFLKEEVNYNSDAWVQAQRDEMGLDDEEENINESSNYLSNYFRDYPQCKKLAEQISLKLGEKLTDDISDLITELCEFYSYEGKPSS